MKKVEVKAKIFRFDPGKDEEPYFDEFELEIPLGYTVVDLLHEINDIYGADIEFEASCNQGFCGKCGLRKNGEKVLACQEFVKEDVKLEPLHKSRVLKDLKVDKS